MNSEDLIRFLTQSLADRKLSGGEKSALADWLTRNVKAEQHRGLVRHAAFEVARTATAAPAAADLVEWLEGVTKVLAPLNPNPGAGGVSPLCDERADDERGPQGAYAPRSGAPSGAQGAYAPAPAPAPTTASAGPSSTPTAAG